MSYIPHYTPYRTERGWRFRCCMNAESEPFKSEQECRTEAAKELAIDTKRSKLVGVMGDIYREAFESINQPVNQ